MEIGTNSGPLCLLWGSGPQFYVVIGTTLGPHCLCGDRNRIRTTVITVGIATIVFTVGNGTSGLLNVKNNAFSVGGHQGPVCLL